MTDQLGRVLGGRYRLTAPVGTGSSAQVFLAEDVALRRRVAVKVLHPALASDEAFLRRFRAEARAAAGLSHPNLMVVYDWGEDEEPYLVLEYLGGGSLRGMLDLGTRLTPSQAAAVGADAARALDAAHRRSFVHRDIKPANLLFGDDGRLRIADFGLARALSEAAWTEPGDGLVGTARYAAPEQASGPRIDGKADVYSLGLVLIEAVTGKVPLTADTALGTLVGRVEVPVPVPDALGPLQAVLERVGRPSPADRPTADELAEELVVAARSLERPGPLALAGALPVDARQVDPTLLPGSVGAPVVDLRHDGLPEPATTARSGPHGALFDELAADPDRRTADAAVDPPGGRDASGGVRDTGSGAGRAGPGGDGTGASTDAAAVREDRGAASTPGADATVADASTSGPDTTGRSVPLVPAARSARRDAGRRGGAATEEGPGRAQPDGGVGAGARRRPWRRVLLVVPVVLVALGAAGWFGYRAYVDAQPTSAPVPRVATLERDAAEAELAAAERSVEGGLDWEVVVEEEHNEVVLAGFVIDQDPQTGTELDDGGTVRLLVSLGPPPRPVPDLFNRTEQEVRTDLDRGELTLGDVQEQHVEDVEAGRVITWSVAGQDRPAEAPKGSEVDLVLSSGPAPRTVPPLEGAALDAARAALEELGLLVQVSEDFSSVAEGLVISSSPEDGATLARGGTVEVVVSKGRDLVVVPDVAGSSIDGAIAGLRANGLVEGDVSGPAGGDVNATDPEAGASVERGTVVDLFLRR